MSKQLDCYYNDYVIFESDLMEDLADEKHGEEVKTIITKQQSYIDTVSNLKTLESQANKTIDKLGEITVQAKNTEDESKEFEVELNKYKSDCITDCGVNAACVAGCNAIEYNSDVVVEANKELKKAYDILKDNEVLSVSQLIDTEINKVEVITLKILLL